MSSLCYLEQKDLEKCLNTVNCSLSNLNTKLTTTPNPPTADCNKIQDPKLTALRVSGKSSLLTPLCGFMVENETVNWTRQKSFRSYPGPLVNTFPLFHAHWCGSVYFKRDSYNNTTRQIIPHSFCVWLLSLALAVKKLAYSTIKCLNIISLLIL